MPKERGPDYVPLSAAYEQYGRRPVDRLRGKPPSNEPAVLTEATWEGDETIYLLRAELESAFGKPRLTRGGEQVG